MSQLFTGEVIFDSPLPKEGSYGPFFSMALSMPENAPGVRYNEKYSRHEVYISFDNKNQDEHDYLMSLSRGDQIQLIWTGKKYTPLVPNDFGQGVPPLVNHNEQDEPTESQSAFHPSPPASATSKRTMSDLEQIGAVALGMQAANTILGIYSLVRSDPRTEGLENDEILRISISSAIDVRRAFPSARAEMAELGLEEIVGGLDPDGLPGNLLALIAERIPAYSGDVELAKKTLSDLGLSSKDIEPDDPRTWVEIYKIASDYAPTRTATEEPDDDDGDLF